MSIVSIESPPPGCSQHRPECGRSRDRRESREISCRPPRSEIEREACLRLRAEVYVWEQGWISPEQLVDGLEIDDDDLRSVHLLASRAGEPVGTARLILPRAGRPLPVESMLAEPLPPGRRAGEVSRLAVAHHARGDSTVMMALCRELHRAAVEHHIDDFYAIIEEPFHRHLGDLGLPFRPVGLARWIYRTWNFPVRLEVARVAAPVAAFYSQHAARASQAMGGVA